MATQYTTDIPFSSSHTQQALKLLELPPELLTLLESSNPPILTITTSPTTGFALLSHGAQQYQMRQKNTSNPLLLLQPSSTGPTQGDDIDTFVPRPSVTAVAKIEDTIELILQEEIKKEVRLNKWHEKFAKSRGEKK
ncbi:sister chromatid cohesion protein Dcc1 [Diplocarpon rosae]|nr:sister chromatid cohesion protein Dcc1 [Diplocarpon rosae]